MMGKLFIVLAVMAVLALLLAVTAMAFAIIGKEDRRVWVEYARVRRLAELFQYSLLAALALGAAAWIVQP